MPAAPQPLVFVVDDEEAVSITLAAILGSSGFTAEAFIDPIKALKAAGARCPDLLITEVMMPQLNGIELGTQFKALYPECRVLLLSEQAAIVHLLRRAESEGHHFDVLAKPIHPNEILTVLLSMVAPD
jgi:FixJ family two-component response regulator